VQEPGQDHSEGNGRAIGSLRGEHGGVGPVQCSFDLTELQQQAADALAAIADGDADAGLEAARAIAQGILSHPLFIAAQKVLEGGPRAQRSAVQLCEHVLEQSDVSVLARAHSKGGAS
jgi:hypothetical protein